METRSPPDLLLLDDKSGQPPNGGIPDLPGMDLAAAGLIVVVSASAYVVNALSVALRSSDVGLLLGRGRGRDCVNPQCSDAGFDGL